MIQKNKFLSIIRRIRSDLSGVSMVEFALTLPILLTVGLFGTEIARLATTRMKVSQVALSLADNAARLGQTDNSGVTPTISENDVAAVLAGALRQGDSIGLEANGRVILSSLEYDTFTGKQYIHWQRCVGSLNESSTYGDEEDNNGLVGDELGGMGRGTTKLTAQQNTAIMYVEIIFDYTPLFESPYGSGARTIRQEAGFQIRDDRNLRTSDVKGLSGTAANTCL